MAGLWKTVDVNMKQKRKPDRAKRKPLRKINGERFRNFRLLAYTSSMVQGEYQKD